MSLFRMARLAILALSLAAAGALQAGTIGPNCQSCYGATYTLTNLGLWGSTNSTQTYRIKLAINTTGYNGGTNHSVLTDYIQSVAVKVTNNVLSASLVSDPFGTWTLFSNSGLSNAGCNGHGKGFVCAQTTSMQNVTDGSTYSWVFDIQMAKNGLMTTGDSIKANYDCVGGGYTNCNSNGTLVSEDIDLGGVVPEPATFGLLAGGVGVWMWSRRKRQDAANA